MECQTLKELVPALASSNLLQLLCQNNHPIILSHFYFGQLLSVEHADHPIKNLAIESDDNGKCEKVSGWVSE